MIAGIGTDIVSIPRVEALVQRYGDRFAKRILSDAEYQEYLQVERAATFLAKRFAAKEAAAKALGTGFRLGITKRDISVGHDDLGKPLLVVAGSSRVACERMQVTRTWLSLSDEKHYALAFVVLETD